MGKGGGSSGQPTQTTSNVTNTNVPEYARPYVENMLGATQKQLFKMDGNNITGFQPYKAYGGTYDEAGNQTAYDPSKAVAGFSPMQQQAMAMANGPEGFAQNVGGYMSPYMQNVTDIQKREATRQSGIMGAQQQAQATQAGAFGGSRDAIQRAERERNLSQQMGDIQAQGSQAAFANAQNQFNTNLGQMTTAGAMQQQNQQQSINQAMQDYANAQQYPLMQLGTMSNMLRGLPMQAQTTQQYQAQANPITQGIGALGAGASLYNATKAEGGVIKGMASGGITSVPRYDVGGAVVSQLATMPDEALKREAMESPSPRVREMAAAILKQRQAGLQAEPQAAEAPQGVGPMNVDYNANYAGGGIIAFAEGEKVKETYMGTDGKVHYRNADRPPPSMGITDILKKAYSAIADPIANYNTDEARAARAANSASLRNFIGAQSDAAPAAPPASASTLIPDARTRPALPTDPEARSAELRRRLAESQAAVAAAQAERPQLQRRDTLPEPPALRERTVPLAGPPVALPPLDDAQRQAMVADAQQRMQAGSRQGRAGILSATPVVARAPVVPGPAAPAPAPAPADTAATAAAPPVSAGLPTSGVADPFAGITEFMKPFQDTANKTTKALYEEDLAAKKAMGLDNSEARQAYMKKAMDERANLDDQAYRTNQLRRAQMFAEMASTPGNTIVAAMVALKNRIPDMLQDVQDQRLARQQADKIIYDLGEADRLEKLGMFDKASTLKQEAIKNVMNLQAHVTTARASYAGHLATANATLGAAATNAAGNVQSHKIMARSAVDVANIQKSMHIAVENIRDLTRQELNAGRIETKQQDEVNRSAKDVETLSIGLEKMRANPSGRYARNQGLITAAAAQPGDSQIQEMAKAAKDENAEVDRQHRAQLTTAWGRMVTIAKKNLPNYDPGVNPYIPVLDNDAPTMSAEDTRALRWANSNPNDPRSAAIKARLGK